jgi:hypothetical protein
MSTESVLPGFTYFVSDEQLRVYATLSVEQRMQWVEDTRQFTWHTASAQTRAAWLRLREHPPRVHASQAEPGAKPSR